MLELALLDLKASTNHHELCVAATGLLCSLSDTDSIPSKAVDVVAQELYHLTLRDLALREFITGLAKPRRGIPVVQGAERLVLETPYLSEHTEESASLLLASLLELVRGRAEDRAYIRGLLIPEPDQRDSAWMEALLVLLAGAHLFEYAAFVNGCHTLTTLLENDEALASTLVNGRLLVVLGKQLERACEQKAVGAEWMPAATAAVHVLDLLISRDDFSRYCIGDPCLFKPLWACGHRPYLVVDSVLAALKRSFVEATAMSVQTLHLSALRVLMRMCRFATDQALRIMLSDGLMLGVRVMLLPGLYEDAAILAMSFLVEVAGQCRRSPTRLADTGAIQVAHAAQARYPWSETVRRLAAEIEKACCSPPHQVGISLRPSTGG